MIIYKLRKYFFYYFFILFISCTNNQLNEEVTFSDEKITWSKHIAPILFKNCTSCHRPGESGPFNLLNYSDATKKAKLIKFVTQTGFMPPWPADINYSHFVGERVLKKSEIELIKKASVPFPSIEIAFFDLITKSGFLK